MSSMREKGVAADGRHVGLSAPVEDAACECRLVSSAGANARYVVHLCSVMCEEADSRGIKVWTGAQGGG